MYANKYADIQRIYSVDKVIAGTFSYNHLMRENVLRQTQEREQKKRTRSSTDVAESRYIRPALRQGDRIKIKYKDYVGKSHPREVTRVATVDKSYPHHAIIVVGGKAKCYTLYDLWQMMDVAK